MIMVLSRLQACVLPSVSFVLATWASRISRSRFCSVAVRGHDLRLCARFRSTCGAMRCGAMRAAQCVQRNAMRCGEIRCGAMRQNRHARETKGQINNKWNDEKRKTMKKTEEKKMKKKKRFRDRPTQESKRHRVCASLTSGVLERFVGTLALRAQQHKETKACMLPARASCREEETHECRMQSEGKDKAGVGWHGDTLKRYPLPLPPLSRAYITSAAVV